MADVHNSIADCPHLHHAPRNKARPSRALLAVAIGAAVTIISAACGGGAEDRTTPATTTVPDIPTDARLQSLQVDGGSLQPAFNAQATDYAMACKDGPNKFHLNATATPGATVSVVGAKSGDVQVTPDELIEIIVQKGEGRHRYWIRCLPPDFPKLVVDRPGNPSPGYYLFSPSIHFDSEPPVGYAVILDTFGAPIWYRRTETPTIDVDLEPNGNLSWAPALGFSYGTDPDGAFSEYSLTGTKVRDWATVGTPTDHHELLILDNGNALIGSYRERAGVDVSKLGDGFAQDATVADAVIQEVTAAGKVVWEWDSKDHIGLAETTAQTHGTDIVDEFDDGRSVVDLVHLNSLEIVPDTGDVIVSTRHLDAVFAIRRDPGADDDGDVLWKLGGAPPTNPATADIKLSDDPLNGFILQHDARLTPEGQLTVFDNRSDVVGGPARALKFDLDLNSSSAKLVSSINSPDATASPAMGSYRVQPDGAGVVGWGASKTAVSEFDKSGELLLRVTTPNSDFSYRAIKVDSAALNPADLRAAVGESQKPRGQ